MLRTDTEFYIDLNSEEKALAIIAAGRLINEAEHFLPYEKTKQNVLNAWNQEFRKLEKQFKALDICFDPTIMRLIEVQTLIVYTLNDCYTELNRFHLKLNRGIDYQFKKYANHFNAFKEVLKPLGCIAEDQIGKRTLEELTFLCENADLMAQDFKKSCAISNVNLFNSLKWNGNLDFKREPVNTSQLFGSGSAIYAVVAEETKYLELCRAYNILDNSNGTGAVFYSKKFNQNLLDRSEATITDDDSFGIFLFSVGYSPVNEQKVASGDSIVVPDYLLEQFPGNYVVRTRDESCEEVYVSELQIAEGITTRISTQINYVYIKAVRAKE